MTGMTRPAPLREALAPEHSVKDAPAGRNLLFLREEELRLAQDLLFFGYRDFTAGADQILAVEAADPEVNLMPTLIDAAGAYVTLGEIMGTMANVFGRHVEVPTI